MRSVPTALIVLTVFLALESILQGLSTWGVPAITAEWTFPEPIEITIQNVDL
ncbi:MAG TPA: hypothetical protein VFG65_04270 [Fimbriimonadales bacterium]|nr:hypothetical protein [Fimbriimonadales bacterium]